MKIIFENGESNM